MPGAPWKVTAPLERTLRHLSPLGNFGLRRRQRFQFSDERRNLFVTGDSAELRLRNQEPRPNPALSLVATVPAFHVLANLLHNGERRLDHIGEIGRASCRERV